MSRGAVEKFIPRGLVSDLIDKLEDEFTEQRGMTTRQDLRLEAVPDMMPCATNPRFLESHFQPAVLTRDSQRVRTLVFT